MGKIVDMTCCRIANSEGYALPLDKAWKVIKEDQEKGYEVEVQFSNHNLIIIAKEKEHECNCKILEKALKDSCKRLIEVLGYPSEEASYRIDEAMNDFIDHAKIS